MLRSQRAYQDMVIANEKKKKEAQMRERVSVSPITMVSGRTDTARECGEMRESDNRSLRLFI